MEYRQLGNSDLKISEIGFGCMSLELRDSAHDIHLIQHALEGGINFFDTADLYAKGKNEELLGKALQGNRKRVIISTKVGNKWRDDGAGWDWTPTRAHITKAVEASLKRLKTDYIDLYQLHGGTVDDNIEELVLTFETLKSQGKIRYYGISSIRPNVIRKWLAASNMTSVMMQYSILDRRPEELVMKLLEEHKIKILARGVLAKGLLAGKGAAPQLEFSQGDVNLIQQRLNETGYPMSQLAVSYVLQSPVTGSAVLGFRTMEQLTQTLNFQPITVPTEVMSRIPRLLYKDHR